MRVRVGPLEVEERVGWVGGLDVVVMLLLVWAVWLLLLRMMLLLVLWPPLSMRWIRLSSLASSVLTLLQMGWQARLSVVGLIGLLIVRVRLGLLLMERRVLGEARGRLVCAGRGCSRVGLDL